MFEFFPLLLAGFPFFAAFANGIRLFADGRAEFTAFTAFVAAEFTAFTVSVAREFTAVTVDAAAVFTAPRAEFVAFAIPFTAEEIVVVEFFEFPVVNMGPILCILKITNRHPEECLVFVCKNAPEKRRSLRRSEFRLELGSGTRYRIPTRSVHV